MRVYVCVRVFVQYVWGLIWSLQHWTTAVHKCEMLLTIIKCFLNFTERVCDQGLCVSYVQNVHCVVCVCFFVHTPVCAHLVSSLGPSLWVSQSSCCNHSAHYPPLQTWFGQIVSFSFSWLLPPILPVTPSNPSFHLFLLLLSFFLIIPPFNLILSLCIPLPFLPAFHHIFPPSLPSSFPFVVMAADWWSLFSFNYTAGEWPGLFMPVKQKTQLG